MTQFTFDELLAKREQAEQDKLAVTEIAVPNTDRCLQFHKPTKARMLDIYGMVADADSFSGKM